MRHSGSEIHSYRNLCVSFDEVCWRWYSKQMKIWFLDFSLILPSTFALPKIKFPHWYMHVQRVFFIYLLFDLVPVGIWRIGLCYLWVGNAENSHSISKTSPKMNPESRLLVCAEGREHAEKVLLLFKKDHLDISIENDCNWQVYKRTLLWACWECLLKTMLSAKLFEHGKWWFILRDGWGQCPCEDYIINRPFTLIEIVTQQIPCLRIRKVL